MNAIDTNVLVYCVSPASGDKCPKAAALVARFGPHDTLLPWQVACEFGAVLTRLVRQGRATASDLEALTAYRARFPVVMPTAGVLDLGLHIHRHYQVAYWDALLIAACAEAGVDRLYSEDVPSRPEVAGVTVINPFI